MKGSIGTSATTTRVLKALSIFGGAQALGVICAVVRTKVTAVLIGPAGVGILAVLVSTMDLLTTISQLSLRQSAVRDLSAKQSDESRQRITGIVRRLALLLGFFGLMTAVVLSPFLSRWGFGNSDYILSFVCLAPMLLFSSVAGGETAIMQGYDKLGGVAKSSVYSALTGVAVSIPLLYFFRVDGLVPVLLTYSFCLFAFSLKFGVHTGHRVKISTIEALKDGKSILGLGIYMTLSTTFSMMSAYLFVVFLNHNYDESTVGIFQSGYTLINSYVGIIFTAIAVEFYPRLSSVIGHTKRAEVIVSHEIKIAMSVLVPLVLIFASFAWLAIKILYTSSFEAVLPFVTIGMTGCMFRAISWCMAFVILAKGDGKIYLWSESLSAVLYLVLFVVLFRHMGFLGLGIAYTLWYLAYTVIIYLIYRRRYGMRLRGGTRRLCIAGLATGIAGVVLSHTLWLYAPMILLVAVAIVFKFKIKNRPKK